MAVVKQHALDDVLSFLYYFLRYYAETTSHIVQSTQAKINKLMEKMNKEFHWNMGKFTTYISALLVALAEISGKENIVFEIVYIVLT